MPRWETLLRRVLRWTPRDLAERQKFPRFDLSEATMNCFSNSRLACSRVKPRRTSSSTIWYRRPLRFWSAKWFSLGKNQNNTSPWLPAGAGCRRPHLSLRVETVAQVDRIPRGDDLRDRRGLVDREHGQLADRHRGRPRPVQAVDGEDVPRRHLIGAAIDVDHVVLAERDHVVLGEEDDRRGLELLLRGREVDRPHPGRPAERHRLGLVRLQARADADRIAGLDDL